MESNEYSAEIILSWRRNLLSNGGRHVELDWLLDIGAGLSWVDLQRLYLYPQKLISLERSLEELSVIWGIHLREGRPLQHLIGKCYWRDFQLEINSDALIPRQETELLIDFALEKVDQKLKGFWVDLGTGSGALSIALSKALPRWEGHAVDCSQSALALAKRNLRALCPDSKVKLHLGSWWEPLKRLNGSIDLAIANPPYIPTSIMNQLDPMIRNHEPEIALCGGLDGLDACREVVAGAIAGLSSGGWLIFEHHHDQGQQALQLMEDNGFKNVSFKNDLEGINRFVMGCRC